MLPWFMLWCGSCRLWIWEWRIRNVFRQIGCVFDRVCNTVWIITRESLSLDREPSYLSSPVSIKFYPWIKQCLWIPGWFWLNYTLYKECLLRENDCQRGGQKSPWLGSGSSLQNEPWRDVSGNGSQNICTGTKDTWLITLGFGWDHRPGFVQESVTIFLIP